MIVPLAEVGPDWAFSVIGGQAVVSEGLWPFEIDEPLHVDVLEFADPNVWHAPDARHTTPYESWGRPRRDKLLRRRLWAVVPCTPGVVHGVVREEDAVDRVLRERHEEFLRVRAAAERRLADQRKLRARIYGEERLAAVRARIGVFDIWAEDREGSLFYSPIADGYVEPEIYRAIGALFANPYRNCGEK